MPLPAATLGAAHGGGRRRSLGVEAVAGAARGASTLRSALHVRPDGRKLHRPPPSGRRAASAGRRDGSRDGSISSQFGGRP
jgi:hypothetical protein